jgi:putative photosynthetic complex assembly protein
VSAIDEKPFPKGPLAAAVMLVAVSLVGVGASQAGLLGAERPGEAPAAASAASRDLRFLDRADGAVVVQRVDGGGDTVLAPGDGGFVRGVLRGMARERKARGLGAEAAFRLTEWSDGRLTLEDTATGRRLGLDAFGPTNRDAFAALLRGPSPSAEGRT